jgi:hypothetical protein
MQYTEVCIENSNWSSLFLWVSQKLHIYYIEEFLAALLHAENVKHLFYTIVYPLMMGQ